MLGDAWANQIFHWKTCNKCYSTEVKIRTRAVTCFVWLRGKHTVLTTYWNVRTPHNKLQNFNTIWLKHNIQILNFLSTWKPSSERQTGLFLQLPLCNFKKFLPSTMSDTDLDTHLKVWRKIRTTQQPEISVTIPKDLPIFRIHLQRTDRRLHPSLLGTSSRSPLLDYSSAS